jgi:hypothetical protein
VAIAIVVNPSTNIGDLSLGEVRKLFMGEKSTLPHGKPALLLMAPVGTPERTVVLRQVYRMTESEFAKFILRSVFTGHQLAPREVDSAHMKQAVSENVNAIGYLPISQVDAAVRPVLLIR